MNKREFITLLGGAAAAWPPPVGAQQSERLPAWPLAARAQRPVGFLLASTPTMRLWAAP